MDPEQQLRIARVVCGALREIARVHRQMAMHMFVEIIDRLRGLASLARRSKGQPFAKHKSALGPPKRISHVAAVVADSQRDQGMSDLQ